MSYTSDLIANMRKNEDKAVTQSGYGVADILRAQNAVSGASSFVAQLDNGEMICIKGATHRPTEKVTGLSDLPDSNPNKLILSHMAPSSDKPEDVAKFQQNFKSMYDVASKVSDKVRQKDEASVSNKRLISGLMHKSNMTYANEASYSNEMGA